MSRKAEQCVWCQEPRVCTQNHILEIPEQHKRNGGKKAALESHRTQFKNQLFTSCMTLGKLPNNGKSQFSHL